MNKLELIDALRVEAGLTKPESGTLVDLFFNEMTEALANGDRVEIRGLCSFSSKSMEPTAVGIRKQARKSRSIQRSCHFSSVDWNLRGVSTDRKHKS